MLKLYESPFHATHDKETANKMVEEFDIEDKKELTRQMKNKYNEGYSFIKILEEHSGTEELERHYPELYKIFDDTYSLLGEAEKEFNRQIM